MATSFTIIATGLGGITALWALFAKAGLDDSGGGGNLLVLILTIPVAVLLGLAVVFLVPVILAVLGIVLGVAVIGMVFYGLWRMFTSDAVRPLFRAFFVGAGRVFVLVGRFLRKAVRVHPTLSRSMEQSVRGNSEKRVIQEHSVVPVSRDVVRLRRTSPQHDGTEERLEKRFSESPKQRSSSALFRGASGTGTASVGKQRGHEREKILLHDTMSGSAPAETTRTPSQLTATPAALSSFAIVSHPKEGLQREKETSEKVEERKSMQSQSADVASLPHRRPSVSPAASQGTAAVGDHAANGVRAGVSAASDNRTGKERSAQRVSVPSLPLVRILQNTRLAKQRVVWKQSKMRFV